MTRRKGPHHSGARKSQNDDTAEVAKVAEILPGTTTRADHRHRWFDPLATEPVRPHRYPRPSAAE
jgi:hypothetical protein